MFFTLIGCMVTRILILEMLICENDDFRENNEEVEYYMNTWAVRILGGVTKARMLAEQMGFDSRIEVFEGLSDLYLLRNSKYAERMKCAEEQLTKKLHNRSEIQWVEQQVALRLIPALQSRRVSFPKKARRKKRTKIKLPSKWVQSSPKAVHSCLNLNDKHWSRQHYIQDCRDKNGEKPPRDLNVVPAWTKHRLSGKNVKVIVVDDGVETNHPDLVDNYDPTLGLDLQDNDTKPEPVHYWWHKFSHGTRCAGVIGMKANNSICGVGIAPSVTLGAVRLHGPKLKPDFDIARALLFKFGEVDIVSSSWTISHNKKSIWYGGLLSASALKAGTVKGRGGRGVVYVFSCGSRKLRGHNCGMDPLLNSVHTISVASCDQHGKISEFSERCSSIMVTTYSNLAFPIRPSGVITTDVGNGCTLSYGGTSASASIVTGAIALALEANPNLSWRDVQHLLTWTSQVAPLQNNPPGTWMKNAAEFYVSHDFGFGMLDVNELAEMGKRFHSSPPLNVCVTKMKLWKDEPRFQIGLNVRATMNGCEGHPSEVKYLEHAQVTLSLRYPRRGDLQIELTSPSGTQTTLLEPRSFDSYAYGISAWTFESVMMWGENPKGTWTVCIFKNRKPYVEHAVRTAWATLKNVTTSKCEAAHDSATKYQNVVDARYPGVLKELYLIFYGTAVKPRHYEMGPRPYYHFTLPS